MARLTDTSPEAEAIQIDAFRRMGPEGRLHAAIELSQTSRKLLAEGVRHRHPEYGEEEVRLAVIRILLPEELFLSAYPTARGIEP